MLFQVPRPAKARLLGYAGWLVAFELGPASSHGPAPDCGISGSARAE
jgi:hypothetical protein